jgi:hypothetical protein
MTRKIDFEFKDEGEIVRGGSVKLNLKIKF